DGGRGARVDEERAAIAPAGDTPTGGARSAGRDIAQYGARAAYGQRRPAAGDGDGTPLGVRAWSRGHGRVGFENIVLECKRAAVVDNPAAFGCHTACDQQVTELHRLSGCGDVENSAEVVASDDQRGVRRAGDRQAVADV